MIERKGAIETLSDGVQFVERRAKLNISTKHFNPDEETENSICINVREKGRCEQKYQTLIFV